MGLILFSFAFFVLAVMGESQEQNQEKTQEQDDEMEIARDMRSGNQSTKEAVQQRAPEEKWPAGESDKPKPAAEEQEEQPSTAIPKNDPPSKTQADGDDETDYADVKFNEIEIDSLDYGIEDEQYKENLKFKEDRASEGEFNMDDFSPSHVYTFPLQGDQEDCFYKDIMKAPVSIRAAYFVSSTGSMEVDTKVALVNNLDSNSETVLFLEPGKSEGVLSLVAQSNGQYRFCFHNPDYLGEKMVTFALHVGKRKMDGKKELAQAHHVASLEESVRKARETVRELVAEQTFMKERTRRHMLTQDSTEWKVGSFTMLESLLMVAVTIGQVVYVQRLINNRQWV